MPNENWFPSPEQASEWARNKKALELIDIIMATDLNNVHRYELSAAQEIARRFSDILGLMDPQP